MIGYVDKAPAIDLHGNHFQITFTSGEDEIPLMLTKKAFYLLKLRCEEADAKYRIAEMEAQQRVIPFTKPARQKAKREPA